MSVSRITGTVLNYHACVLHKGAFQQISRDTAPRVPVVNRKGGNFRSKIRIMQRRSNGGGVACMEKTKELSIRRPQLSLRACNASVHLRAVSPSSFLPLAAFTAPWTLSNVFAMRSWMIAYPEIFWPHALYSYSKLFQACLRQMN